MIVALCWLSYLGVVAEIGSKGCPNHDYDSLRCAASGITALIIAVGLAGLTLLAFVIGVIHQIWMVTMRNDDFTTMSPFALGIQGLLYYFVPTNFSGHAGLEIVFSSIIGVSCVVIAAMYSCARGSRKQSSSAAMEEERQPLVDVKNIL